MQNIGACQIRCEDPRAKKCQHGIDVCARHAAEGCAFVVTNPSGEWATLKRRQSESELADLNYPGKALTADELTAARPALEAEGAARRANSSGFAAAATRAAPALSRAAPGSSKLCGSPPSWATVGAETVALVALSYRTPATLRRSVASWHDSGLLGLVDERILLLNDPSPAEVAVGLRYGFDVRLPSDLGAVGGRGGARGSPRAKAAAVGPRLRAVKPEVLTIGAAFAAAVSVATSTHVLFLEKDFAVPPSHTLDSVAAELAAAVVAARRGAAVVRLRSIEDQGCGTFRKCAKGANNPDWNGATTFARRRNWWSFYCRDFARDGAVADCGSTGGDGAVRCFTSWDSNWSLNAVLVDRVAALEKKWVYKRPGANGKFRAPGISLAQSR